MHVLFITINYPNSYNDHGNMFYRDQALSLNSEGITVGVISALSVSLSDIIKQKKLELGFYEKKERDINIYLYQLMALPKLYNFTNKLCYLFGKKLVKKYIQKYGKPDIIHNHVSISGKVALWAKNKYNIPFIVTEHSSNFLKDNISGWQKKIARKVFLASSKNIAVSKNLMSNLIREFDSSFEYIPNITDVDFFKPKITQLKPKNEKVFLHVGNLLPVKNQELLIRAFTKAFSRNNKFKLIIVGGGPKYDNLVSLINSLKMDEHIKLTGQLPREKVLNIIRSSDYFVLASKYETFGVVLIEAMACGLPVISTNCGGPESIIVNSKLGILCKVDSENELIHSMQSVLTIDYDRNYIRSYIIKHFSNEAFLQKIVKIYSSVICEHC